MTCETYDGESAGPLVGVITADDFRVAFCGPGRAGDCRTGSRASCLVRSMRFCTASGLFGCSGNEGPPVVTRKRRRARLSARDAGDDVPAFGDARRVVFRSADALVTDATHHVFVVDAFHGRAVRVITPADVLRAVAAPGRAAIGWRYRERSDAEDRAASREKRFEREDKVGRREDVRRRRRRAGGCLGALEISDDFKKRGDDRSGVPVGFAGRFDDEM